MAELSVILGVLSALSFAAKNSNHRDTEYTEIEPYSGT
jgi:hypothetical protein